MLTCGGNGYNIVWSLADLNYQRPLVTKENQKVTNAVGGVPVIFLGIFVERGD